MLSQINRIAHEFPNSLFSLNPKCTYLELERRIEAVSEQIQHLANQVLVVLANNTLNHVILALACLRTGVIYAILRGSKRQALFLIKPENFLPVSNYPLTY